MSETDWGSATAEEDEVAWFGPLRIERTTEAPEGDGLSVAVIVVEGIAKGVGTGLETRGTLHARIAKGLAAAALHTARGIKREHDRAAERSRQRQLQEGYDRVAPFEGSTTVPDDGSTDLPGLDPGKPPA